jgi:predicted RNA-binding protein YlqC (UPF0109 family)
MDSKSLVGRDDRSKINIAEEAQVKIWTRRLGVSKDDLEKAIDKVGNSVAAVKKQLEVAK